MTDAQRQIPRDGRLVSLIAASKGIEDADERVIQQLLDFAHRYTADVLQSAQTLADHAGRPGSGRIEKEDVELAIQMRRRYEFFEAPPRDYLATIAHDLNAQPLPILPESFEVIRLPPPHQRLAEVNFEIVPDTTLVLADEEDESDESEEEDDDEPRSEGQQEANANGDDMEGEDEEMEEVGLEPQRQEREVDEDYDE